MTTGTLPLYPEVTLKISWHDLLGDPRRSRSTMLNSVRRERWEAWKALAPADLVEWWQDCAAEVCHGCRHCDGDWCMRQHLPAAVNPVTTFRHGLPGMACMGIGREE